MRTCTSPRSSSSRASLRPTRSCATRSRARLHLVPRYRQRLATVPFDQGRPVWVDDPHFNIGYHVRHTALPAPGSDDELKRLAGRLFAQPLDRSQAAVGDLARRAPAPAGRRQAAAVGDGLQDPPRARRRRLRRRHHGGAVRRRTGPGAARAARPPVGARARRRRRLSCSAEALLERATLPRRGPARAARTGPRAAAGVRTPRRGRRPGSAPWPGRA